MPIVNSLLLHTLDLTIYIISLGELTSPSVSTNTVLGSLFCRGWLKMWKSGSYSSVPPISADILSSAWIALPSFCWLLG